MIDTLDTQSIHKEAQWVHGAGIAIHGQGVLLSGASGIGKTEIVWRLLGRGCPLISDDTCIIEPQVKHIPPEKPADFLYHNPLHHKKNRAHPTALHSMCPKDSAFSSTIRLTLRCPMSMQGRLHRRPYGIIHLAQFPNLRYLTQPVPWHYHIHLVSPGFSMPLPSVRDILTRKFDVRDVQYQVLSVQTYDDTATAIMTWVDTSA